MNKEEFYSKKLDEINAAFENGDIHQVIKLAEEARSMNETKWRNAEILLKSWYDRIGNYHGAIDVLEDLLSESEAANNNPSTLCWLHELGREYGKLQPAESIAGITYFMKAINLMINEVSKDPMIGVPKLCNMYTECAVLNLRFGLIKPASECLQEAIKVNAKYGNQYWRPSPMYTPFLSFYIPPTAGAVLRWGNRWLLSNRW